MREGWVVAGDILAGLAAARRGDLLAGHAWGKRERPSKLVKHVGKKERKSGDACACARCRHDLAS